MMNASDSNAALLEIKGLIFQLGQQSGRIYEDVLSLIPSPDKGPMVLLERLAVAAEKQAHEFSRVAAALERIAAACTVQHPTSSEMEYLRAFEKLVHWMKPPDRPEPREEHQGPPAPATLCGHCGEPIPADHGRLIAPNGVEYHMHCETAIPEARAGAGEGEV